MIRSCRFAFSRQTHTPKRVVEQLDRFYLMYQLVVPPETTREGRNRVAWKHKIVVTAILGFEGTDHHRSKLAKLSRSREQLQSRKAKAPPLPIATPRWHPYSILCTRFYPGRPDTYLAGDESRGTRVRC